MFKTLACLVVSMTGGAVLLGWLEPQVDDYASGRVPSPDLQTVQVMARRAVRSAELPRADWNSIEVLALAGPSPGLRGALAATPPPPNLQFMVAPSGRVQTLPGWQPGGEIAATRHTIRVAVMTAAANEGMSIGQRLALRALLAELREHTRSKAGLLPIRLAEETHLETGALREDLRVLLADPTALG